MKSPKTEKLRKDKVTVKAIEGVASEIAGKISKLTKPEVSFPVRSLGNVHYDPRKATSRSDGTSRSAR